MALIGKKGFIRIFEVFLALTVLFAVVDKVYIGTPPRFGDPENLYRLKRYSKDIALSLCYNEYLREYLVNDSIPPFDLNWTIPADIDFHIYLYSNATNDHKLDDLVNESGSNPGMAVMATTSCVISGYLQPEVIQHNVTDCEKAGADCTSDINVSDNTRVSLSANQNFSVKFQDVSFNSRKLQIVLEGNHSGGVGDTNILVYNGTDFKTIQTYSYGASEESPTFTVTGSLPDANGQYNITIKPTVAATYDYVTLYATKIEWNRVNVVYKPRKIVVGVWNKE